MALLQLDDALIMRMPPVLLVCGIGVLSAPLKQLELASFVILLFIIVLVRRNCLVVSVVVLQVLNVFVRMNGIVKSL
ncbi:uncharacterized protein N7469_003716 [Penicillium citrinum]|uniref:Uncharacterized protein n=1 Tax=Penicillium citrinum TaxID=5077 RepID=A0A9W9TQI2_PENCI|nr:uncharacterized protein N7469_003716 [Penicillium citrinum]KAJ5234548.1 hypothetical protein N7469_003716 [Penicillium citrinum]